MQVVECFKKLFAHPKQFQHDALRILLLLGSMGFSLQSFSLNAGQPFLVDIPLIKGSFSRLLYGLPMFKKQSLCFLYQPGQGRIQQYLPDWCRERQKFAQGRESFAGGVGDEALRDDQAQAADERCRYLKVFFWRKDIEYACDRGWNRTGMHGGIGRDSCFRAGNQAAQGFPVAAFSKHNHIGRSAG